MRPADRISNTMLNTGKKEKVIRYRFIKVDSKPGYLLHDAFTLFISDQFVEMARDVAHLCDWCLILDD